MKIGKEAYHFGMKKGVFEMSKIIKEEVLVKVADGNIEYAIRNIRKLKKGIKRAKKKIISEAEESLRIGKDLVNMYIKKGLIKETATTKLRGLFKVLEKEINDIKKA